MLPTDPASGKADNKSNAIPLRVIAALLALIHFVGIIWFPRVGLTAWQAFYLWAPFLALAIGSLLPDRLLTRLPVKVLFSLVAAIAIVRNVQDGFGDLHRQGGADYPALAIRAVVIAVLTLLWARSWRAHSTTKKKDQ